jgi:hypothetical protein
MNGARGSDEREGEPAPAPVIAATVVRYSVPFVKPSIVHEKLVVSQSDFVNDVPVVSVAVIT